LRVFEFLIEWLQQIEPRFAELNPQISMITPQQLGAIIAALTTQNGSTTTPEPRQLGQQITVLDRGFVYVGTVTINGDFVNIENAKNIRIWGTKQGLGELRNGPLSETKVDVVGDILVPLKAVIHFISCKGF
jgi:hypothetical protein